MRPVDVYCTERCYRNRRSWSSPTDGAGEWREEHWPGQAENLKNNSKRKVKQGR